MDWAQREKGSSRQRAAAANGPRFFGVMTASLVEPSEHGKAGAMVRYYGKRKTKPVLALIILAAGMGVGPL